MARAYVYAFIFAPAFRLFAFIGGAAIALAVIVFSAIPALAVAFIAPIAKLVSFMHPRPLKPVYRESWLSHGHSLA